MDEKNGYALLVDDQDNVAIIFANAKKGDRIQVIKKNGEKKPYLLLDDIPYGHKFAVKKILEGEPVIKYGEALGVSTGMIEEGEHVHVHNLESVRARGDWVKS